MSPQPRSLLFALVLVAACRGEPQRAATNVVDSAVPRAEALRRFQSSAPRVDTLATPFRNRDSLVAAFMDRVQGSDTAALQSMTLTPSEFGWLYYPTTPQGLPPYSLNPDLMWFMTSERSGVGLARLLAMRGGAPLALVDYRCDERASHEGINTVWGPCQVRWRGSDGVVSTERLFGLIIEREERYKFVSFANDFD